MIEGMASGLPVVCSRNRGHNSLITHNRNGYLFDLRNPEKIVNYIEILFKDIALRNYISENNINDVQQYSLDIAVKKMAEIYYDYM
jgi:glycosyltransferase EpsD